MTDRERFRPFTGDTETKVRLTRAPIALVVCQVRWPEFSHLQGDLSGVAQNFGKDIEDYPLASSASGATYTITPDGVTQAPGGTVYSWSTLDGSWHVNLGSQFLTLYGTSYTEFSEFQERFKNLLRPLEKHVRVRLIERLGVRYVNRPNDSTFVDNLGEFVRPEVLGLSSLLGKAGDVTLHSSINQAQYEVGDYVLHVRSGILAAGQTFDPAIPPSSEKSWVLDLDSSIEKLMPFDSERIIFEQGRLADIDYDFFKYVSGKGFIREFGGSE